MFSLCKCIRFCGRSHLSKLYIDGRREPGTRQYASGESLYDTRKFSKELPKNDIGLQFECLPEIPTGVFRATDGEILGPYAGKCSYYRNPEYFAFHDMSFFDLALSLSRYRQPAPKTGRKPL